MTTKEKLEELKGTVTMPPMLTDQLEEEEAVVEGDPQELKKPLPLKSKRKKHQLSKLDSNYLLYICQFFIKL